MAVITISRQLGALGEEVGRGLAERLQYQYVDRTTLAAAVRTYSGDVSSSAPEIQEKSPTFWERFNEERHRYKVLLRSALLNFASQDNVVLMGMGGAFLLADYSHVLRLLIVSPTSVRAERVARLGTPDNLRPMDVQAAREAVRRDDRERAGYVRYLFNADWLDPTRYDLVLNTGRMSVPEAIDTVACAIAHANLALTTASRAHLQDATLASQVESTLLGSAGVWVHSLRVTAEGSIVYLSGEVISGEDRDLAEELALRVPGVTRVVNDLRIQPPPLTGM